MHDKILDAMQGTGHGEHRDTAVHGVCAESSTRKLVARRDYGEEGVDTAMRIGSSRSTARTCRHARRKVESERRVSSASGTRGA
jgi:hypothetical protein